MQNLQTPTIHIFLAGLTAKALKTHKSHNPLHEEHHKSTQPKTLGPNLDNLFLHCSQDMFFFLILRPQSLGMCPGMLQKLSVEELKVPHTEIRWTVPAMSTNATSAAVPRCNLMGCSVSWPSLSQFQERHREHDALESMIVTISLWESLKWCEVQNASDICKEWLAHVAHLLSNQGRGSVDLGHYFLWVFVGLRWPASTSPSSACCRYSGWVLVVFLGHIVLQQFQ